MIVLFGCGQMGTQLAIDLEARGEQVIMIDPDRFKLEELSKSFKGQLVMGLGIDREVLKRGCIEKTKVFIAVSRDINTNIMAAQVAKNIFKVPRVIARIENAELVDLYISMGIEAVSPTAQAAKHIETLIERS
jgi:trk system potassium uptake protein TrkA